jgi:hypothetical protein
LEGSSVRDSKDGLHVHQERIICEQCAQSYEFHYSKGGEHRIKEWLPKARAAVNISHTNDHSATVAVPF